MQETFNIQQATSTGKSLCGSTKWHYQIDVQVNLKLYTPDYFNQKEWNVKKLSNSCYLNICKYMLNCSIFYSTKFITYRFLNKVKKFLWKASVRFADTVYKMSNWYVSIAIMKCNSLLVFPRLGFALVSSTICLEASVFFLLLHSEIKHHHSQWLCKRT